MDIVWGARREGRGIYTSVLRSHMVTLRRYLDFAADFGWRCVKWSLPAIMLMSCHFDSFVRYDAFRLEWRVLLLTPGRTFWRHNTIIRNLGASGSTNIIPRW